MSKTVKVVSVTTKTDANAKEYKSIRVEQAAFSRVIDEATGETVLARGIPKATTLSPQYLENYLPTPQKDPFYDAKENESLLGSIVTRNVTPYMVNENTVNSYTVFVPGNTADASSYEVEVQKAFKQAGHPLETIVEVSAAQPSQVTA